jgi:subtilisin family serine protease
MVASAGNRCTHDAAHGEANEEGGDAEGGANEEGGDSGCDSDTTFVKFPAAYSHVIAVVATDSDNKLTDYNRSGPEVDLAAPGGAKVSEQILSTTINGSLGLSSGSSQAAAHVTGAVAVALQLAPWLSAPEVVDLLKASARDLGYVESYQGAGLLAVDAMVKSLLELP